MENDNSEDALTWNVFYYLDSMKLIDQWLSNTLNRPVTNAKVLFWTYDSNTRSTSKIIREGRLAIGEDEIKGTEPDIVIVADECVCFIEAKLFSGNNVAKDNATVLGRYEQYRHYDSLFKLDYKTISSSTGKYKKYELARNWLLGDSIRGGKVFYLINLVRDEAEKDISVIMDKIIVQDSFHQFRRITWESIFSYIKNSGNEKAKILADYMREKCSGYTNGVLGRAFNL